MKSQDIIFWGILIAGVILFVLYIRFKESYKMQIMVFVDEELELTEDQKMFLPIEQTTFYSIKKNDIRWLYQLETEILYNLGSRIIIQGSSHEATLLRASCKKKGISTEFFSYDVKEKWRLVEK